MLAVRNLCEGNEAIQQFVGEMQAQGASAQSFDDEALREMGMEIRMEGEKPVLSKKE